MLKFLLSTWLGLQRKHSAEATEAALNRLIYAYERVLALSFKRLKIRVKIRINVV